MTSLFPPCDLPTLLPPTIAYSTSTRRYTALACGLFVMATTADHRIPTIKTSHPPPVHPGMELLALVKAPSTSLHHTLHVPDYPSYRFLLKPLEFDGATKRNKPNLKHGDTLFVRVEKEGDGVAWCTCKSRSGQGKDWVTAETDYGVLQKGVVVRAPEQMKAFSYAADEQGKVFEVAVGRNGWCWVRGDEEVEKGVYRVGTLEDAKEVWGGKKRKR